MSRVARAVKSGGKKKPEAQILHGPLATHIPAGEASGSPPLGTQLGQRGVNIPNFVKDFNTRTKDYKQGIPLLCKVWVNPDKSYKMLISKPPIPYLLLQAAGVSCGSGTPGHDVAGKLTLKHIYEIAQFKSDDYHFQASTMKEIVRRVIRFSRLCGIEIVKEMDPEEYAKFLVERKEKVAEIRKNREEQRLLKMQRA